MIVARDGVRIHLKDVAPEVAPQPNVSRHPWAPWDAFVFVEDPDALAAELASRAVEFHAAITDRDDGLRGFEVRDSDGYVLFFGRPNSTEGSPGAGVESPDSTASQTDGEPRSDGEEGRSPGPGSR